MNLTMQITNVVPRYDSSMQKSSRLVMLSGLTGQFPLRQDISEASRSGSGEPGTRDALRPRLELALNAMKGQASLLVICIRRSVLTNLRTITLQLNHPSTTTSITKAAAYGKSARRKPIYAGEVIPHGGRSK